MEVPEHIKNRIGLKYNMLTVVEFAGFKEYPKSRQTLWKCLCDCGNFTNVTSANLQNTTKSCGCWNSKRAAEHGRTVLKQANTKHGLSYHPLYDAWDAMMARCYNPEDKDWDNYGGRGIGVCDRWRTVTGYVEDLVERPEGMTLDRIDVDGDYCPENCKWSSYREQGLNTRFNRDYPNVYPDGVSWKAMFQWKGERYYVGMYATEQLANEALQSKLIQVGWYDQ